jgi:D-glycero-alpha-D-manno-heptose 1-phosphate guanylyltransferase
MDSIILAGGLGTRLRSSIGDAPKCMAPVNGHPFLYYLLQYLETQGCSSVVLSLGYKHEIVTDWLKGHACHLDIKYSIESEPLGTGGAIALAMSGTTTSQVAVLNGDTIFRIDMPALTDFHQLHQAEVTLALKQMQNYERYGSVKTDTNGRIIAFEEKKATVEGLINGGIYVIDKARFQSRHLPQKFSFEKDYLEAFVAEGNFYGLKHQEYFLDIGVPEDYELAQEDFKLLFT